MFIHIVESECNMGNIVPVAIIYLENSAFKANIHMTNLKFLVPFI